MKRLAAHYIYCNPERILKNAVVEYDDNGRVLRFFSLAECQAESHSTAFYNGILLPELLKENDLSEFRDQSIIEMLHFLFQKGKTELKEGVISNIYLVENTDLHTMKFTEDCTLRKI